MSIDVERSADPVRVRSRGGDDAVWCRHRLASAGHQEEQWVVRIGHDVEANQAPGVLGFRPGPRPDNPCDSHSLGETSWIDRFVPPHDLWVEPRLVGTRNPWSRLKI